jgi:tetratricopeptide (TPR) repeat protein
VALKLYDLNELSDGPCRERFFREARALCGLDHKNICGFRSYGVWNEVPYFSMELVEGKSLEALLRERGRLTCEETRDIGVQACDALQAAHEQGILHRDLKPANLLVEADGCLKVIDFGLASFSAQQDVQQMKLTKTGLIVGSVLYMSPEQAEAQTLTPASEVYSLGCVLYQCLAGKPPFWADSALGLLNAHCNDKLPAFKRELNVQPALDKVLRKAMAKDPRSRYQTMAEFRKALLQAHNTFAAKPKWALYLTALGVTVVAVLVFSSMLVKVSKTKTDGTGIDPEVVRLARDVGEDIRLNRRSALEKDVEHAQSLLRSDQSLMNKAVITMEVAKVLFQLQRNGESETAAKAAATMFTQLHCDDFALDCRLIEASCSAAQYNHKLALERFLKCAETSRTMGRRQKIEALTKLADQYYRMKVYGQAEPVARRLVDLAEQESGSGSTEYWVQCYRLGQMLHASRKDDEARLVLQKFVDWQNAHHVSDLEKLSTFARAAIDTMPASTAR